MSFASKQAKTANRTPTKSNDVSTVKTQTFKNVKCDSSVNYILNLQKTMGNQAVQRLIQTRIIQAKLKVSQNNDSSEKEADKIAELIASNDNLNVDLHSTACSAKNIFSNQDTKIIRRKESNKVLTKDKEFYKANQAPQWAVPIKHRLMYDSKTGMFTDTGTRKLWTTTALTEELVDAANQMRMYKKLIVNLQKILIRIQQLKKIDRLAIGKIDGQKIITDEFKEIQNQEFQKSFQPTHGNKDVFEEGGHTEISNPATNENFCSIFLKDDQNPFLVFPFWKHERIHQKRCIELTEEVKNLSIPERRVHAYNTLIDADELIKTELDAYRTTVEVIEKELQDFYSKEYEKEPSKAPMSTDEPFTFDEEKKSSSDSISIGVLRKASEITETNFQQDSNLQEKKIQNVTTNGQALPDSVKSFFSGQFGYDFENVKIHTDVEAANSAKDLNALAYTVGQHIVFGEGKFEPDSTAGRKLLAHELAHVVQQAKSGGETSFRKIINRKEPFSSAGPGITEEVNTGRGSTSKNTKIKRFLQAEVDEGKVAYGMECLGSSIMYLIQSYGLVPANMSRKEFEYAFTPLNPEGNHKGLKTKDIEVDGKKQGAKPVDLFSKILEPKTKGKKPNNSTVQTEDTLRGNKGVSYQKVIAEIPEILAAFQKQAQQPGYEFMKTRKPIGGALVLNPDDKWIASKEVSQELFNNTLPSNYFEKGNTVMVELSLHYPATSGRDHWSVIVGKAKENFDITDPNGEIHHLYPADDPWYGASGVLIMVPPITDTRWLDWIKHDKLKSLTLEKDDKNQIRTDLLRHSSGNVVLPAVKGENHFYKRTNAIQK